MLALLRPRRITLGEVGIAIVWENIREGRFWRLVSPRRSRRRDGCLGAVADRGQRCRLALGCVQGFFEVRQATKARHVAKADRAGEADRLERAA